MYVIIALRTTAYKAWTRIIRKVMAYFLKIVLWEILVCVGSPLSGITALLLYR